MKAEYLREKEMEHVFAGLTPENALVMRVCIHTGLRVSDVLCFKPPVKAQFWITEQKTGKKRRVNLVAGLVDELNKVSGRHWVFEGRSDSTKHRTRQAVWKDIKKAAKFFKIPVNVSPHTARKIYAVNRLDKEKGDITKVQKALNHDRPEVTILYAIADKLYESKYEEIDGRIVKKGGKRGRKRKQED